jgi:hypothetical protein
MSDVLRVQWTIIPGSAPELWLNCNRCRGTTRFRTSGKIRVNANGKRVDAWLIYKCTSCDNTWNRPVLERRHLSTIDPQLLASLQANDPDLSRQLAFEKLRRKLKVEHFDDATVRKEVVSESAAPLAGWKLSVSLLRRPACALTAFYRLSCVCRAAASRICRMPDILLHPWKACAGLCATGCM